MVVDLYKRSWEKGVEDGEITEDRREIETMCELLPFPYDEFLTTIYFAIKNMQQFLHYYTLFNPFRSCGLRVSKLTRLFTHQK